jgi:hypothetical protein
VVSGPRMRLTSFFVQHLVFLGLHGRPRRKEQRQRMGTPCRAAFLSLLVCGVRAPLALCRGSWRLRRRPRRLDQHRASMRTFAFANTAVLSKSQHAVNTAC